MVVGGEVCPGMVQRHQQHFSTRLREIRQFDHKPRYCSTGAHVLWRGIVQQRRNCSFGGRMMVLEVTVLEQKIAVDRETVDNRNRAPACRPSKTFFHFGQVSNHEPRSHSRYVISQPFLLSSSSSINHMHKADFSSFLRLDSSLFEAKALTMKAIILLSPVDVDGERLRSVQLIDSKPLASAYSFPIQLSA